MNFVDGKLHKKEIDVTRHIQRRTDYKDATDGDNQASANDNNATDDDNDATANDNNAMVIMDNAKDNEMAMRWRHFQGQQQHRRCKGQQQPTQ